MDLTNKKYGKLLVLKKSKSKYKNNITWDCLCDCGNKIVVTTANLNSHRVCSCGCLKIEKLVQRSTKHNQRHTHLYEVWKSMKQRCYNPKLKVYKNWGARGIKICEDWLNDFQSFYDWSMTNGYKDELTIDRIDVNGNYEPSNCRWVDRKTQAANTRLAKLITINGESKCIAEWCRIYNVNRATYNSRVRRGLSAEEALTKK